MMKLNLKNNKAGPAPRRGFTLLEVLVAISILMVAVAAPITIAQKGLSSAVYSKDQMIASYLAQDAIEYIKNRRDLLTINDPNFSWGSLDAFALCKTDSVEGGNGCRIDTVNNGSITYDDSTLPLTKDLVNGFYSYDSTAPATKFYRNIKIKLPATVGGSVDEALVTVTVYWSGGSVAVSTLIYNY